MRCFISSSVACAALPYFSILSHKGNDFRKMLLNIKCVFLISRRLLSETFVILRRIHRHIIINVHRTHKLIISISNKEELPEEMKETIIVPIYKKCDKTDSSNHSGISLLPTT